MRDSIFLPPSITVDVLRMIARTLITRKMSHAEGAVGGGEAEDFRDALNGRARSRRL